MIKNTDSTEYLGQIWSLQYYSQLDNIYYGTRQWLRSFTPDQLQLLLPLEIPKLHGSHSENCNKRDLQNTFRIQSLQISEYLNYNTHTSPWSMLPKYSLIL